MVGTTRIELVTPAMSTQCSTTELRAHAARLLVGQSSGCNSVRYKIVELRGKLMTFPALPGLCIPRSQETVYHLCMVDSPFSGFTQHGDDSGRWPLVLASPHSGQDYPEAFLAGSQLTLAQLRRAEDPFVDRLLDDIVDVPVLAARYGRAYLDLNRAATELDPAMFDALLPAPVTITDRVKAGLGVLPRIAAHGLDIYRRRIDPAEALHRLTTLHQPWHDRISLLLARAKVRHGHAILLDCHSMPQPAGVLPPQIVIGDRFGTSAAPALVALIEQHFREAGWRVARNIPYAGGYTTEYHAGVTTGIHAVQIEIDRTLYMDPTKFVPNAGFDRVASVMTALVPRLLTAAPQLGLTAPCREAAE